MAWLHTRTDASVVWCTVTFIIYNPFLSWIPKFSYNFIFHETNARVLWDKIEYLYAYKSRSNNLYLLKSIEKLFSQKRNTLMKYLNLGMLHVLYSTSLAPTQGLIPVHPTSFTWLRSQVKHSLNTFISFHFLKCLLRTKS